MKFTITIDVADDDLAELFRAAQPGPGPAPCRDGPRPGPGRSLPPEEDDEPEARAGRRGETGREFLRRIAARPDARAFRGRAISLGKKLGYGWQIAGWSPAQVAEVRERLAAQPPDWGGVARRGAGG